MTYQDYSIRAFRNDIPRGVAWNVKVRRKGWERGHWVTVSRQNNPCPIFYLSEGFAREGAKTWIEQNGE